MVIFLLKCTIRRPRLVALSWKFRLWVDFKIEPVFFLLPHQPDQEGRWNFIYSYEEMGAAAVDSHNLKFGEAIIKILQKNCWRLSFWVIEYELL